jgi:hypothetical protein
MNYDSLTRTLGLFKDHLSNRKKSNPELESKVTVELIVDKLENAISRGANEL